MSDQPEISVVMSVYNGAQHLRESMDSILSQEGVDLEFIVVNDGSTDNSGKILDEYAQKDNRVRVFHQKNQGLTKALITGCAQVRGKYIARQDAGDISLPRRLISQKKALDKNPEVVFVSCWTEFFGPEWEPLYVVKGTSQVSSSSYILKDEQNGMFTGPTAHPSVMFRKQGYWAVGGYRKEFYYAQDWDLWYRLAEAGKFLIVPEILYRFHLMPGSLSGRSKKGQDALMKLVIECAEKRSQGLSDEAVLKKAELIRPNKKSNRSFDELNDAKWLYFIGENLRKNEDDRAARYFKKSLEACPFHLRAWARLLQMYFTGKIRS